MKACAAHKLVAALLFSSVLMHAQAPQSAIKDFAHDRNDSELAEVVTWTQLPSPSDVPPARSYPAMTYDPVSRKIVLFGGYGATGYLNDTWTFDGVAWAKEDSTVAPPPRCSAGMAFDYSIRRVVLFGGFNGNHSLADSWIWDGATSTWKALRPTRSPVAVAGAAAFTDPANGRVDIYGGFDGDRYHLEMYQWSGKSWNKLGTQTPPWARAFPAAVLNPRSKSIVLFSGLADINSYNTWTWNGTTWAMQAPDTQPPSRYGSAGAFVPAMGGVIMFGGGQAGFNLNDTWMWTGVAWKQLFPIGSPPAREGFGMAYHPALGQVVLFGGGARGGMLFNDTWLFTVTGGAVPEGR